MTFDDADRPAVLELAPLLRRAVGLDAATLVRVRMRAGSPGEPATTATAMVRLPFRVLVARTVATAPRAAALDATVAARELLDWLDGVTDEPPPSRDADWRAGLPPVSGWQEVESVPDHVVRPLVRTGALALKDAAAREGVPGAQPRAEVADALLDSAVLTASGAAGEARVTLRAVSALTRMGFLPRGGRVRIDVCGRWARLVAEYGTVYLEQEPGELAMLRR